MRLKRAFALIVLATAWAPSDSMAQSSGSTPTAITLRPAAEPRPALKYRLVPERIEQIPGNAAIFYHRAIQMVAATRTALDAQRKTKQPPPARPDSTDDRVYKWVTGPIGDVPVAEAREILDSFQRPLSEIEQGARRTDCDWEFDRRPEGISLLLPDIQEMRSLARLVALQARVAILDGKTDDAMKRIESGLVMGRHVAKGPIVIQALVGIAIDFTMIKCLEDLIQIPGTPSLYWALADRPRPFISMRESFEGERYLLEKEIPGLDELDNGIWGIDKARKFADTLQRKLFSFDTGRIEGSTTQRFAIAGMTSKIYPEARRALIAEGRPASEVDAMPVVQVASLYCYHEYRGLLDDSYKWMNLPFWQSSNRIDPPRSDSTERKLANPLLTMFRSLNPALSAARTASVRLDRQLDALQCIEAIRLDAEAHGGKLPETLESIADAPVPLDPTTGKPFGYKLEGDSATLSSQSPHLPDHLSFVIRYVLKLVR